MLGSDRLERILRQLSKAIISAINSTQPQHKPLHDALLDLARLGDHPHYLTEMAYEWCSVICAKPQSNRDIGLVSLALKTGFRHFDPQDQWIPLTLTHTEHHRELVGIVFENGDSEMIADLLHAWAAEGRPYEPAHTLLGLCTDHLVDLPNRMNLSSRLRRLVIRSVEFIGHDGFQEGETKEFVELLNYLHIDIKDMDDSYRWTSIFLEIIQSSEGARHLSVQSWELLAELATLRPWLLAGSAYDPQVAASLLEGQEWDKLECWVGIVWMVWPPQTDATTEDVERATALLLHQQPGAVQKLTERMERWRTSGNGEVPEAFRRICGQPHETASRLDAP